MRRFLRSYGFYIFWMIACIDLLAILIPFNLLHFVVKPLLMPVLTFTALSFSNRKRGTFYIITALFFSFAGDILLMLDTEPLFFILGLIAFLITHIFYIVYFLGEPSHKRSLLAKQPLFILVVVGYGVGLLFFLKPHLGNMIIPVIAYAVIICTMLLTALHIYFRVNTRCRRLFITGAILFVLSDSLLAINKFYSPIYFATFFIMLMYCAAQYLIIKGYTKNIEHID